MYTLQCLLWNQIVLIVTPKYCIINNITVSMFIIASMLKENTTAVSII